jgi:hypothetical protein
MAVIQFGETDLKLETARQTHRTKQTNKQTPTDGNYITNTSVLAQPCISITELVTPSNVWLNVPHNLDR